VGPGPGRQAGDRSLNSLTHHGVNGRAVRTDHGRHPSL